jgi:hypothetical protein
MCRAEIFTKDCNKVEQTLATVTHRRQVDFKKRKKEKDKYERVQLKKEKEERLFLLKKERDLRGTFQVKLNDYLLLAAQLNWEGIKT